MSKFRIESNTPMRQPPADYFPAGSARWFTIGEGYDAGKKLFCYDYQTPGKAPIATVLFVHGNPESSYTYRHIRDHLLASGQPIRIVAMDHIGFGLSDQADFEMVDFHHAANVLQLVRHLDLQDITLVVHDWGGPIGVGALIEDHARVRNLLVMNTTIFPMPPTGLIYPSYPIPWLGWPKFPDLIPDVLWGGVAGYIVSHAVPQSTVRFLANGTRFLIKHALHRFEAGSPEYVWSEPLRTAANAKSSKRNARQTPVWGHGYRYDDPRHGIQDNHEWYRRMQAQVPLQWGKAGRSIPTAGFFGQWDPCGKDEVIAQWQQALPAMKRETFIYPDVGHFIEEYKGPEMAEAILRLSAVSA